MGGACHGKRPMKIATAAYPVEWHNRWNDFVGKLRVWVRTATEQGAEVILFPEYGVMEIASLAGEDNAKDLKRSAEAVIARIGDVDDLHASLAREFGVFLCAASAPVRAESGRIVNRARFFAPDGSRGCQDKLSPTRFEREAWDMADGEGLTVFETSIGRIAILVGEDATLPSLGAALAGQGVDLLLVPGQTSSLADHWRLRIGAMARAVECGCAVAQAVVVGDSPWVPAVERSVGTAAIYVPPGTAEDGVLAIGKANTLGWTTAEIDPAALRGEGVAAPAAAVSVRLQPLGAREVAAAPEA